MKLNELQNWIKENLLNKRGNLNSPKIQNNYKWLRTNHLSVYKNIINETKFLNHINPSFSQRIHHILNEVDIIACKCCNNITKFKNLKKGYLLYCSPLCKKIGKTMSMKETKLKKYGDENFNNRSKAEQTCLNLYSKTNPFQVSKFIKKAENTKEEKYGDPKYNNPEQIKKTKERNHSDENFVNSEKTKKTCLEKYGVENVSQTPDWKNKIRQAWNEKSKEELKIINNKRKLFKLEHYGNENYVNLKKAENTKEKRYNDKHFNNRPKAEQTYLKNYNVSNFNNRFKAKETWRKNYGVDHPSQVPEIADKISSYNWYSYILPSGKEIKLQGYEPYALDNLLEIYNEEEILYKKNDVPQIWYIGEDNKKHRYYPDFYIPKNNLVIEVKSTYTYNKELNKNLLKAIATKNLNYNFEFMIIKK